MVCVRKCSVLQTTALLRQRNPILNTSIKWIKRIYRFFSCQPFMRDVCTGSWRACHLVLGPSEPCVNQTLLVQVCSIQLYGTASSRPASSSVCLSARTLVYYCGTFSDSRSFVSVCLHDTLSLPTCVCVSCALWSSHVGSSLLFCYPQKPVWVSGGVLPLHCFCACVRAHEHLPPSRRLVLITLSLR